MEIYRNSHTQISVQTLDREYVLNTDPEAAKLFSASQRLLIACERALNALSSDAKEFDKAMARRLLMQAIRSAK